MLDPEKVSKLRIADEQRGVSRGVRKWKIMGFVVFILGLLGVSLALYNRGVLTFEVPVQITSVNWVFPSQVVTQFNASGYIVAQRKASVASKATGRLEHLGVKEGSRVKAGEILARLESDDLKAEHAQIEAQLASSRSDLVRAETDRRTAERNLRRLRNLWERRVAAQADFETAEDQHSRAKAQVESAKSNILALEASLKRSTISIEYTLIRAPFDGVVLTKHADMGEIVAPFASAVNAKAAVVTMADLSSLMAETDVAESFLSKVKEGQACEIQMDALPEVRFLGKVATIVPTADRTRGTVLVKVRFDQLDPRIMPEMSARVAFLTRPLTEEEIRPRLAAHRDTLAQRNRAQGVFRIENRQVRWIPLPTAESMGDYALAIPPLEAGDQIVMKPVPSLENGDRVKIAD